MWRKLCPDARLSKGICLGVASPEMPCTSSRWYWALSHPAPPVAWYSRGAVPSKGRGRARVGLWCLLCVWQPAEVAGVNVFPLLPLHCWAHSSRPRVCLDTPRTPCLGVITVLWCCSPGHTWWWWCLPAGTKKKQHWSPGAVPEERRLMVFVFLSLSLRNWQLNARAPATLGPSSPTSATSPTKRRSCPCSPPSRPFIRELTCASTTRGWLGRSPCSRGGRRAGGR